MYNRVRDDDFQSLENTDNQCSVGPRTSIGNEQVITVFLRRKHVSLFCNSREKVIDFERAEREKNEK
jgi:hypothetical protein